MNFILAFLSILGSGLILRFGNATSELMQTLYLLCYYSAVMNTGLGVFNLIPFPPLDGSNVLEQLVPRVEYFYMRIRPYRTWILLLLLASGVLSRPLTMANSTILGGMWEICGKGPWIWRANVSLRAGDHPLIKIKPKQQISVTLTETCCFCGILFCHFLR